MSMKKSGLSLMAGAALALLLCLPLVHAQDAGRDPTVAPGETAGVSSPATAAGVEGMTVLVRDGKPFLVVGTRQYAPGDTVGTMRLQRITEKEVWFHDGSALIKVQRFAGIERKTVAAKPRCAVDAKRRVAPAVAACEDIQP